MELAGFTIGVVGLAGQLAKAAMDCYKIFDGVSNVGSTYDAILHQLRTQGLLLKGWEQAWGFGSDLNQQQRLDPGDYRYRYATASLARIVAVFASVDKLQAKYGIVVQESIAIGGGGAKRVVRLRDRLSVLPVRLRGRSKSPGPSTTSAQIPVPGITNDDLRLLENPQVLENKEVLPGLGDEIKSMTQAMDRVQQSLPLYLKLCWVLSDNAKLEELLKKLTGLNDGLFRVLPPSQSSTILPVNSPLKLVFDIPLFLNVQKNCGFVGREYLLEDLRREIEAGKDRWNIVVLYGTGGMGKTQLALEYVYQHYKAYSSVFWVNAASVQTTILGFTQIMKQLIQRHIRLSEDVTGVSRLLGMAGKLDSTGCLTVTSESEAQHVVDAVKQWLAAPENTNWLVVFDNLDDLDLVNLEEYLPSCNHGTVIITSRRRETIQHGRRGFEVQQMHPTEAIQLLLSTCAIPRLEDLVSTEQTAASTIALELGYLPLALSQAGAYIHIAQYSLSRYLKEYQTNAGYLLSQRWTGAREDRSVFATWEISFKAIQEKCPKAAELLLICGFFDHEDIREELLRRGLKLGEHDLGLEQSIRTLFSYSLVKRGSSDNSFSIHPLVHSWARLRLKSEPQKEIEKAREAFEIVASGVRNSGDGMSTEDWIFEQQAMPHVDAVMQYTTQYLGVGNMEMPNGVDSLGAVYIRHGRNGKAMEWYTRALDRREEVLGAEHVNTLYTVHQMACVFDNQGQYDKALEWYERALAGEERTLGVDHEGTLTTVYEMASVFANRGQYEKALEWYGRALAGEERTLGGDHPSTLTTVHSMASVLDNQGQYDNALEWYGRVLAGREKALGVNHPETLDTVHRMASVFAHQAQYDKALEWYGRALAGKEKALGVGHPETLDTVHKMGLVFAHQAQYDKALKWYGRALAGKEKALGVDHPNTLTTVHSMASVLDNQGQYDNALEWYGRALAGKERTLGVNHPLTLDTVHRMASVFAHQAQYDKALKWYDRALTGMEKALGADHPRTLSTVHEMASVFNNQGQYNKALEWYGRALAGEEKALGVEHLDTLATVHNIAAVFHNQGQYDKALEWYGRVLAGVEKALGVDHPNTLTTVHGMASVLDNQGQYDNALEWYGRALAGTEKVLGVDHPSTLTTVHGMASVLDSQGQYDKALEWYRRVLAGRQKALGMNHPSTLTTVQGMASVFNKQGQYEEALEWHGRALSGMENALGIDHPDTLTTAHEMGSVFKNLGQYAKALEWYGRALAGRERILRVDHPDTLVTVHEMASVFNNQGHYGKALEWYGRALAGRESSISTDHPSTQNTIRCLVDLHEKIGQTDRAQTLRRRLHLLNDPSN